ncbi:MAG: hypothetical protein C5B49_04175 [Bdellovibrio sp.]|nr:MAG: hypothetical protein C5B49_04175 [Bdellovibrio sp.]
MKFATLLASLVLAGQFAMAQGAGAAGAPAADTVQPPPDAAVQPAAAKTEDPKKDKMDAKPGEKHAKKTKKKKPQP